MGFEPTRATHIPLSVDGLNHLAMSLTIGDVIINCYNVGLIAGVEKVKHRRLEILVGWGTTKAMLGKCFKSSSSGQPKPLVHGLAGVITYPPQDLTSYYFPYSLGSL